MSSGVERCRGVSSGVEGCRGVSRCRVWHLDTVEHGFSLDGVEGCRGVSRGVELVELAWGVEVSSQCRARVEVWCRGVEARAQSRWRRRGWRWRRRRRSRQLRHSNLMPPLHLACPIASCHHNQEPSRWRTPTSKRADRRQSLRLAARPRASFASPTPNPT